MVEARKAVEDKCGPETNKFFTMGAADMKSKWKNDLTGLTVLLQNVPVEMDTVLDKLKRETNKSLYA